MEPLHLAAHLNTTLFEINAAPAVSGIYDHSLHGWIGGDDPLLNTSWDALDQILSPSSMDSPLMSDLDHKPLSSLFYNAVCHSSDPRFQDVASAAITINPPNPISNVGLNLGSLFSVTDRAFAERAARFSSYPGQCHSADRASASAGHSFHSMSTVPSAAAQATRNLAAIPAKVAFNSEDVAMELGDAKEISDHTSKKSKRSSPQSSVLSNGSKKRRAGYVKDAEVEDDSKRINQGKRTQKSCNGEYQGANKIPALAVKPCNRPVFAMNNGSEAGSRKQQSRSSISSTKSDQTREITKSHDVQAATPDKPDVIHVRARRGQATDSHSLAERVRREKLSERMKYLQDLVPGCTKVTGKAMMLDEIINYVQSLQHQVEFLSMKLAAVPPSKLEFNFQSLFGKEATKQESTPEPNHNNIALFDMDNPIFLHHDARRMPLQLANPTVNWPAITDRSCSSAQSLVSLQRAVNNMQLAEASLMDTCVSNEISDVWDNDLHNNMVQMGFAQTPLDVPPNVQGALPHGQQLKTEM